MTIKNKIFGTDGIRNIVNRFPLVPEVALSVGRTVARKFYSEGKTNRIIVGKDTRLSCYMFESAISSGICSAGVDVLLLGPIPTPAIGYLTKDMRAIAGIMITASHNSFEYNGIKIFGPEGFKLSTQQQKEIEDMVLEDISGSVYTKSYVTQECVGKIQKIEDARGRYISYLKRGFPPDMDLCGMKIALDCAHGAAYRIGPEVFRELGADIFVIGDSPNGTNINDCGAMNSERLKRLVIENKCDIGIAVDGDSDRIILIDEFGKTINGDITIAILAKQLFNDYGPQTIVTTIMSNAALDKFIKDIGGDVVRTDVGDRNIIEEMRNNGYRFGAENSGHIIFSDFSTTGDGLFAAIKILEIMKKNGKSLSDLSQVLIPYPQVLVDIIIKEKVPLDSFPELKEIIDFVTKEIGENGHTLVRLSGTENKLRIMIEHKNRDMATLYAEKITNIVKKYY